MCVSVPDKLDVPRCPPFHCASSLQTTLHLAGLCSIWLLDCEVPLCCLPAFSCFLSGFLAFILSFLLSCLPSLAFALPSIARFSLFFLSHLRAVAYGLVDAITSYSLSRLPLPFFICSCSPSPSLPCLLGNCSSLLSVIFISCTLLLSNMALPSVVEGEGYTWTEGGYMECY